MPKQKYVEVAEVNTENKMIANKCMCGEIALVEISFSLKEDQFQSSTERKRICFNCACELEVSLKNLNQIIFDKKQEMESLIAKK